MPCTAPIRVRRNGFSRAFPIIPTIYGDAVLSDHPIEVVLLATDLQASKTFYTEKVGLEIVREREDAVWFKCGVEGRLSISASTTGTADEQTRLPGASTTWPRRSLS